MFMNEVSTACKLHSIYLYAEANVLASPSQLFFNDFLGSAIFIYGLKPAEWSAGRRSYHEVRLGVANEPFLPFSGHRAC